jgi:predicted nucleotidyltransferase component of viral defense system
MIPQRNLSLVSNKLAQNGGTRIPEKVIELDYCLAWFLIGLYRNELGKHLAFKGGTALRRCIFGEYRFSEDLDFTLLKTGLTMADIQDLLPAVFQTIKSASGVEFSFEKTDEPHQNSHTFFLSYIGPLGKKSPVKVDATINELIVLPLAANPVIKTYEEFSDLPEGEPTIVYSAEEIVVEKIAALSDRARQQPRDLYDLWYLTGQHGVELQPLTGHLSEKMKYKGRSIAEVLPAVDRKEAVLRKQWETRLAHQVSELPEFDEVYRSVRRELRQAGFDDGDEVAHPQRPRR